MNSILFLTQKMSQGFGVSVVVEQISRRLLAMGVSTAVACLETDGTVKGIPIYTVIPDQAAIRKLAEQVGARFIVAHTTPFFELLPALQPDFTCWAWEHGDPTPDFFPDDGRLRKEIIENKQHNVYPKIQGVIAISEFIRGDIAYPQAIVIPNGSDHIPDKGLKGAAALVNAGNSPLRIGTLMRLGTGEAKYKGNQLFMDIKQAVEQSGIGAQFFVMGRGTLDDARAFEERSIRVILNATEEEKQSYLRELDVFITCSMWEGFNLPLIEAQAMGTVGIAFDTGAHPEVTPFIVSSIDELVVLFETYAADKLLLQNHSAACYRLSRSHFSWDQATIAFLQAICYTGWTGRPAMAMPGHCSLTMEKFRYNLSLVVQSLQKNGIHMTGKKIWRRLLRRRN